MAFKRLVTLGLVVLLVAVTATLNEEFGSSSEETCSGDGSDSGGGGGCGCGAVKRDQSMAKGRLFDRR